MLFGQNKDKIMELMAFCGK